MSEGSRKAMLTSLLYVVCTFVQSIISAISIQVAIIRIEVWNYCGKETLS